MFITAVCVIFLIMLQWAKNKKKINKFSKFAKFSVENYKPLQLWERPKSLTKFYKRQFTTCKSITSDSVKRNSKRTFENEFFVIFPFSFLLCMSLGYGHLTALYDSKVGHLNFLARGTEFWTTKNSKCQMPRGLLGGCQSFESTSKLDSELLLM